MKDLFVARFLLHNITTEAFFHAEKTDRGLLMAACVENGENSFERALLVSSNAFITRSLQSFFASQGYRMQTLTAGTEALYLLQSMEFALVMVDGSSSVMDDLDLCRRIHALCPHSSQILFVDYREGPTAVEACKAGIDDWIEKPFSTYSVEKIIFRLLKGRKAQ